MSPHFGPFVNPQFGHLTPEQEAAFQRGLNIIWLSISHLRPKLYTEEQRKDLYDHLDEAKSVTEMEVILRSYESPQLHRADSSDISARASVEIASTSEIAYAAGIAATPDRDTSKGRFNIEIVKVVAPRAWEDKTHGFHLPDGFPDGSDPGEPEPISEALSRNIPPPETDSLVAAAAQSAAQMRVGTVMTSMIVGKLAPFQSATVAMASEINDLKREVRQLKRALAAQS